MWEIGLIPAVNGIMLWTNRQFGDSRLYARWQPVLALVIGGVLGALAGFVSYIPELADKPWQDRVTMGVMAGGTAACLFKVKKQTFDGDDVRIEEGRLP